MADYEEIEKDKYTKKISIMAVDDDPVFQKLLSHNLNKLYPSSEVHLFGDSTDALDYYRDHYINIDIVILDMMLPNMNGLELSHEIEKINKSERIILISAYSLEVMISKEVAGAVEFFLAKSQMDPTLKSFPIMLDYYIQKILSIKENQRKRRKAEEQNKKALKEKELLLKEIHHRVKNNMQIISSLLDIQSRNIKDKQYLEMIQDCQNRIESMSLIHEKLYQSKDLSKIGFKDYIKNLANSLFRTYNINLKNVVLKIDVEGVYLGIDTAIPCGLIINEMLSNCLKHAYPEGKEGEIRISLKKISEFIELVVSDNGVGIPEGLDFRNTKSLGLRLIINITEHQLQGNVELNKSKGTEFRIRFKEIIYKDRIVENLILDPST